MKSNTEIRDWLLENAVDDEGDLYMSDLDFSEFDGDVFINGMKIKRDLYQSGHEVKGDLHQSGQVVQGTLYQSWQKVKGSLFQRNQKVEGNYHCNGVRVKGNIYADEPTKILKEVTAEELAEMGYKLKGEIK